MAFVADQKLRKSFSIEGRPLMLKDYLRDDLSSCSSNGFKSFPRRECRTTVRFLLELDLKTKDVDYYSRKRNNATKRLLQRSRTSKAASTAISALQRASEALLNAVKQLPFSSVKSPMPSLQRKRTPKKGSLLARSLSRKLLNGSFWRKAAGHHKDEHTNTIKGWRMFREYLEERPQPSDKIGHQSPSPTTTTLVSHWASTSSSTKRTYSNSWTETDFATDVLRSSSGNSESSSENDAVESKKDAVLSSEKKLVSNFVGESVGEDSVTYSDHHNLKDWSTEEEKEQSSPVSVLDCPFEDDKEISSPPPFQKRLARMEGTKQRLMQKIRCLESLAQLEAVDLEKRIALSELEDESLQIQTPLRPCSNHVLNNNMFDEGEENETEKELVQQLLKLMGSTTQSNSLICKVDNLVSDFFTEKIEEDKTKVGCKEFDDQELLTAAEDLITGQHQELLMGWEVECGRKAYVKEMEKNGEWRNVNVEKEEVGLALELEIFTTLVNELLVDLF